jgi:Holliday junction resolvasome RuvABC endonuclease subunit
MPKKAASTDLQRQRLILARVSDIFLGLADYEKHVFFEDYAFSSFTGKAFTRAELVGILKVCAAEAGCAVYTAGISTLKRYISGKGNASKEEMREAAIARWGFSYSASRAKQDDIVDAFCLTCLGEGYLASAAPFTGVAQVCSACEEYKDGDDPSYALGSAPSITLTKKGWDALCADMQSPPEPNEGLRRLFAYGSARLRASGRIDN